MKDATGDALSHILDNYPEVKKIWDEKYGDRMQKLVFIGQDMDRAAIEKELDDCLTEL